jgi:two-component system, cell cycle response regulator DivK
MNTARDLFVEDDTREVRQRLLVVDDNTILLRLLGALLNNAGYDVRRAASAEDALEILKEFEPHLLLVDIRLPGMDGLQLTARLKNDPFTRDIIVIAMTAYSLESDERTARAAGCDGYIVKPLDPQTLRDFVRGHLRARHPTSEQQP